MTVIKYIFCEGGASSLDRKLLEKIIHELSSYPVAPKIEPSGGKGNLPNFMQGYLRRVGVGNPNEQNAIGFRDRDFDAPVPLAPSLVESRSSLIKLSYRATIENYLISSENLFTYAEMNSLDIGIKSIDDAKSILIEEAKKLKCYCAIRHALGMLRQPINLRTTWTKGSGNLPESLDEEECIKSALDLVHEMKTKVTSLTPEANVQIGESIENVLELTDYRFRQVYNSFIEKFDDTFFENQEFLIWYNCKDLQKSISTRTEFSNNQFSFSKYYEYALKNFEFRKYPDLVELFELLNKDE